MIKLDEECEGLNAHKFLWNSRRYLWKWKGNWECCSLSTNKSIILDLKFWLLHSINENPRSRIDWTGQRERVNIKWEWHISSLWIGDITQYDQMS